MSLHDPNDHDPDDRDPDAAEPGHDSLDDRDEVGFGSDLGEQLRSLLDPDGDLSERLHADVDRTLRGRSVLATGLDLLGLGLWTARELLTDSATSADGDPEGI